MSRFTLSILGVWQVVRGRPGGLGYFGNTPQAVLSALTPLIAFVLVGALVALLGRRPEAIGDLGVVSVALLGPLVLSFEVARHWGRAGQWPRFAAAYCWCQWAMPLLLAAMLVLMSFLMAAGMDPDTALGVGIGALFCYGLWLHWFLARHALQLSVGRAVALVVVVNLATSVLITLPQLADYWVNGAPPS